MILLRHGQTAFNVVFSETRVDPGIVDPVLTDEGLSQARAAADVLRDQGVTRLITSPYTRALQTAEIIATALDLPVTVDAAIRERAAYTCDIGTTGAALAARWKDYGFDHIDEIWWHEGEEPEPDFAERCRRFGQAMARRADWAEIAVVTHWGVIRVLTGELVKNGEMLRFDPTAGLRAASPL